MPAADGYCTNVIEDNNNWLEHLQITWLNNGTSERAGQEILREKTYSIIKSVLQILLIKDCFCFVT